MEIRVAIGEPFSGTSRATWSTVTGIVTSYVLTYDSKSKQAYCVTKGEGDIMAKQDKPEREAVPLGTWSLLDEDHMKPVEPACAHIATLI